MSLLKTVYVIARSGTKPVVDVKALIKGKYNIRSIQLLGSKNTIKCEQNKELLAITMPTHLPNGVPVYVFKVQLN